MLSKEKVEMAIKPILELNHISDHAVNFIKGNPMILEIALERENNESVDLDFCDIVSHQISEALDAIDNSNDAYMLDVCSFGAEKVLNGKEDILNHVNDYVHVDLTNPISGRESIEGTLLSVVDDELTIEYFDKAVKKKAVIKEGTIKLIRLAVKF